MDTRNIGTGGLLVVLTGLHAVEVPEGLRATSPAVAVIAQPPELPTAGALVEAPGGESSASWRHKPAERISEHRRSQWEFTFANPGSR
jgi:hypothetical protein